MKSASNLLIVLGIMLTACSQAQNTSTETNEFIAMDKDTSNWKQLTSDEAYVIVNKGTEAPWKGEYTDNHAEGEYHCRRCDAKLFESDAKFDSGSGWPAFDDAVPGAVTEIPDKDGYRVEIVCSNCQGHLGHVFTGERFTATKDRKSVV